MADASKPYVINSLSGGRNGFLPPWAIPDNQCADAVNVDFYRTPFARKRGGMTSLSVSGANFTGVVSSIFRHVPGSDQTLAEMWAVDDAATNVVARLAGGATWVNPTLKDSPTGNGWDWTQATLNGKSVLAYKSGQARLHCWDGSTVRRSGLAQPAAPTAADTGSGGSLTVDASASLDFSAGTSFSHTNASGATLLFVHVRCDGGTVSGVTYNSVAMTQLAAVSSTGIYYLFYLFSPASGTHTVAITTTGTVGAESLSYKGTVTTGIDASTSNTSSATSIATTLTTIADKCWTVYAVADRSGNTPTAGTNSTLRVNPSATTSMAMFDSNLAITPPGAFTMTAGIGAASGGNAIMASFAPTAPLYSSVLRYYRVRWTRQSSGVTVGRSEASSSISFTPSGSGTAARVTQPSVANEGETHWEVEASTDNVTFYRIATVAIGTTTYDDSAATTSYATNPLSALTGVYTLWGSVKFVAADQNRLLGFGDYTSANKQSRLYIGAVIGSSDVGDDERIDTSSTNYYIDFDENDSGVPTGLAGPALGSFFVFKDRRSWMLTATGQSSQPYRVDNLSKDVGALNQLAATKGEDALGNSALYFMSYRGPYRYSQQNGLEYIGRPVEDFVQTGTIINLAASKVVARTIYYPDMRQVWFWWATGSSNSPNQCFKYDVQTGGWSRVPSSDLAANVRCAVMFSNTVGASMSLDLKPYVGESGSNGQISKMETGTDDRGTTFKASVTTKDIEVGGPNYFGDIGDLELLAKAATGVTITATVTAQFGTPNSTETGTALLTAAGSEARVLKRMEGTSFNGGQAAFYNIQIGDASAVSNGWTLERLIVPVSRLQQRVQ